METTNNYTNVTNEQLQASIKSKKAELTKLTNALEKIRGQILGTDPQERAQGERLKEIVIDKIKKLQQEVRQMESLSRLIDAKTN